MDCSSKQKVAIILEHKMSLDWISMGLKEWTIGIKMVPLRTLNYTEEKVVERLPNGRDMLVQVFVG